MNLNLINVPLTLPRKFDAPITETKSDPAWRGKPRDVNMSTINQASTFPEINRSSETAVFQEVFTGVLY